MIYEHKFLFILVNTWGGGVAGSYGKYMLNFIQNCLLLFFLFFFNQSGCPIFSISPAMYERRPVALQAHQYYVMSDLYMCVSNFSHPNRCLVQSHCGLNSHLVNNVEHLFICSFVMHLSSLLNCLLKCFVHF